MEKLEQVQLFVNEYSATESVSQCDPFRSAGGGLPVGYQSNRNWRNSSSDGPKAASSVSFKLAWQHAFRAATASSLGATFRNPLGSSNSVELFSRNVGQIQYRPW
jgi:hypothetical protein